MKTFLCKWNGVRDRRYALGLDYKQRDVEILDASVSTARRADGRREGFRAACRLSPHDWHEDLGHSALCLQTSIMRP